MSLGDVVMTVCVLFCMGCFLSRASVEARKEHGPRPGRPSRERAMA